MGLNLDPPMGYRAGTSGSRKRVPDQENDGCQAVAIPESEDTSSMPSSRVLLDQVDIAFAVGSTPRAQIAQVEHARAVGVGRPDASWPRSADSSADTRAMPLMMNSDEPGGP
jgi:hypothetical protein